MFSYKELDLDSFYSPRYASRTVRLVSNVLSLHDYAARVAEMINFLLTPCSITSLFRQLGGTFFLQLKVD